MQATVLIFAAALLTYHCAQAESFDQMWLTLYTGLNGEGESFTTFNAEHNLKYSGFNNVAKSVCGVGLWFLYEEDDYDDHSDFVHTFASHDGKCENFDMSMWDQISSVRYAGTEDIDGDSLTLYQYSNLCGGEFLVMRDIDMLGTFDNKVTTFAVTGNSSWTIYRYIGYSGKAACIIPAEMDDGWYYGIWDSSTLHFLDNTVSSIRKGCHTNAIYEYVPKKKRENYVFIR